MVNRMDPTGQLQSVGSAAQNIAIVIPEFIRKEYWGLGVWAMGAGRGREHVGHVSACPVPSPENHITRPWERSPEQPISKVGRSGGTTV